MTSPYHRAKPPVSNFEIPELRHELLFTQRTLYQFCHQGNDKLGKRPTQDKLLKLLGEAFPENLHDLVEDFHNACDWAIRRDPPHTQVIRTAVLFCGSLLQRGEVSTAIPLLKKIEPNLGADRELRSVWAINSAVASERIGSVSHEDLWEVAIQQMPLDRWRHYPSLAQGARNHIRKLRLQHEDEGDLQSLLAAAPLAERAYNALTFPAAKGSGFTSSGPAVRLLIEVARTQHALSEDAFGPLRIPSARELFEEAAANAIVNNTEEDLLVRTLATLAEHHSSCGRREEARDVALSAIAQYAPLGNRYPELIKALQMLFEANQ